MDASGRKMSVISSLLLTLTFTAEFRVRVAGGA